MKLLLLNTLVTLVLLQFLHPLEAAELTKSTRSGRVDNFIAVLKQASYQGANYARDLATSLPLTKILLAGGALLSLFLIFIRLIIVLGPILVLGAMTRESTDTTDLLRMLLEFYNQVVMALDAQLNQKTTQAPQISY